MRAFAILLAAFVGLCPMRSAQAQSRHASRESGAAQRYSSRDRTSRDRSPTAGSTYSSRVVTPRLDAFGTQRAIGMVTRADQVRAESLRRGLPVGLVDPRPAVRSPIAQTLFQRNLLRSRSALGMRVSETTGRMDLPLDAERAGAYQPGLHFEPVPAWGDRAYNQVLADEHKRKAESYFQKAVAACRARDLFSAQQYLGLARQLRPDDPRIDCADVLVAVQSDNLNTALLRLERALDPARSNSLDELKIDWRNFFPSEQDFSRLVRRLNIVANAPEAGPEAKLLLAYFSWLNGDQSTARLSVDAAHSGFQSRREATASVDAAVEPRGLARSAERFRDLLTEAAAPQSKAAP